MTNDRFLLILPLLAILAPVCGAQEGTVVTPRNDRQQSPNLVLNPNSVHERVLFRGRLVSYTEVNGLAVVEGDIVLGPVASVKAKAKGSGAIDASILSDENFRWPMGVIPYAVDQANPDLVAKVKAAIQHWEANTSYRFVPHFRELDFVRFSSADSGCYSYMGMQGGEQIINLERGCDAGNAIHEIGHAVGLWHEQSRNDRGDYVQILFENIPLALSYNFDVTGRDGIDVGYYDYGSIMHYPDWGLSMNGKPTIVTIPEGIEIGQRNGLSPSDIDAVERMYDATKARPYVINTNPPGFDVVVDGTACTTPCTFTNWTAGSAHTVSVESFQVTRRTPIMHGYFARWNDNGAMAHSITANPAKSVVTASFLATVEGDRPDLVMTAMTAPVQADAGQAHLAVSAQVRNNGRLDALPFSLGFYLSGDSTITRSDKYLGWYCRFEMGLAVGATATCRGEVEIPADTPAGTYYIGALADDGAEIGESTETNNGMANQNGSTQVNSSVSAMSDLMVASFSVPAAGAPAGRLAGVQLTVRNRGQGASGKFRVGVYLSKSPTVMTSDVYTRWSCTSQGGLAAGDTLTCTGDIGIPASITPGYYYVAAIADDLAEETESDEGNNARVADPGRVYLTPETNPRPELLPVSFTAPTSSIVGERLANLQVAVKNQGGAAAGPFRVSFFITTGESTSGAVALDRTCSSTGLAAGDTFGCSVDVALPAGFTAGAYRLYILADDQNRVAESDEGNNLRWSDSGLLVVKAISKPDLVVTDIFAPTTGKVGVSMEGVHITVKNQGDAAAGAFRIGLTFVGSGVSVQSASYCTVDNGLPAGESYTCEGRIEIPPSISSGTYVVTAVVDISDDVVESDEANNTLDNANGSGSIEGTARPDLVVSEFAAPESDAARVVPGVSVTVTNAGPTAAGRFRIGFYLGEAFTGWYCMVDGLEPGATATCARNIELPESVPAGSYFFGAIADDLNAVIESNERNNARVSGTATTISALPVE